MDLNDLILPSFLFTMMPYGCGGALIRPAGIKYSWKEAPW